MVSFVDGSVPLNTSFDIPLSLNTTWIECHINLTLLVRFGGYSGHLSAFSYRVNCYHVASMFMGTALAKLLSSQLALYISWQLSLAVESTKAVCCQPPCLSLLLFWHRYCPSPVMGQLGVCVIFPR